MVLLKFSLFYSTLGSNLKVNLTVPIKLKSRTLDITSWDEYPYGGGYVHHSNATTLISLTMDQLKKISKADAATLVISDSKNSMEGNVSSSELELLKQFINECFNNATLKVAH